MGFVNKITLYDAGNTRNIQADIKEAEPWASRK